MYGTSRYAGAAPSASSQAPTDKTDEHEIVLIGRSGRPLAERGLTLSRAGELARPN
jgi:hypothetical protein